MQGHAQQPIRWQTVITLGILAAVPAFSINVALSVPAAIASDLSVNRGFAQLFITLYLLGYAVGLIPVGFLSDIFPRKRFVLVFIFAFAATGIVTLYSDSLPILLSARAAQGFFGCAGAVVARAMVLDIAGKDSARLMSSVMGILALTPSIAPLMGGYLTSGIGFRAPLFLIVCYGVFTILLLYVFVPDLPTSPRDPPKEFNPLEKACVILHDKECIAAIGLVCFPFAGYLVMLSSLANVFVEQFGYSPAKFGWFFSLCALVYPLVTFCARGQLGRVTTGHIVLIGIWLLGLAAGIQLLYLMSEPLSESLLWLGVATYLAAMGCLVPVATSIAMQRSTAGAGLTASFIGTAQFGFGTLLSAAVAAFYSARGSGMIVSTVAVVLVTLAIYVWLRKKI